MIDSAPHRSLAAQAMWAVVGIVAGMAVALTLIIAVEGLSAVVHPVPEGFTHTKLEVCEHVARYPPWVLAVVVPLWGGTAYISTWMDKRLGGLIAASVLGLLLVGAVVLNISMLPYPMWFEVASVVAVAAAVALAFRPNGRKPSDTAK